MSEIRLARHDGTYAVEIADNLAAFNTAAIAGTSEEHDPFNSTERFVERLHSYAAAPGFALVTARDGEDLVGYSFGYLLPAGARWWNGLLDAQPEGYLTETGRRTLAVNEIHVRADHRGQSLSTRVHSELVRVGPQERATLLVREDNPARSAYEHWGYKSLGRLKPFPDSPTYLALVLPLPH